MGRVTQGAIEAELGAVGIGHGGVVIVVRGRQRLNGRHGFLRTNNQEHQIAGPLGLAEASQICRGGIKGQVQSVLSQRHALRGELGFCKRRGYFGGDQIASALKIDLRKLRFGLSLLDLRAVAEAKVVQLPEHLNVGVQTWSKSADGAVQTGAENAGTQRARGTG